MKEYNRKEKRKIEVFFTVLYNSDLKNSVETMRDLKKVRSMIVGSKKVPFD